MPVINRFAEFHDEMTAWRRDLHMHPEIAFQEFRTSDIVASKLQEWGVEVHRGLATTGVVGVLHGQKGPTGKTIGLRADMDALPMEEENEFAHRSRNAGAMHACGHDGHTTMLLGAARYLAETRNFDGTVYFIFQPAEEMEGGAKVMMDQGLFEQFPMARVFGMHNAPDLPVGQMGLQAGPMMAAGDIFEMTVRGKGSHGAKPEQGIDTLVVSAHILTALQTIVSRNVNPIDSAVVTVGQMHGGHTHNVIPQEVYLQGTARTFKPKVRDLVESAIGRVAENVARAFGATVDYKYDRRYPPLVNDPEAVEFASGVAKGILGENSVTEHRGLMMASEDFAFMLEAKPGCMINIGQQGGPSDAMVHHPRYDFNDEILPIGATYWARLVETALPRS
jgi:amidohydrolase